MCVDCVTERVWVPPGPRCQCVLAVLQKGCGYHLDQGVNVCWLCYRKGVATTWTKVSMCGGCVTERVWLPPGPRCQCVLAVLQKGCGYHLDLLIVAILIIVNSMLGLPYFVAATVLSINHVVSLKKESECTAPGERPKFLGVRYDLTVNNLTIEDDSP